MICVEVAVPEHELGAPFPVLPSHLLAIQMGMQTGGSLPAATLQNPAHPEELRAKTSPSSAVICMLRCSEPLAMVGTEEAPALAFAGAEPALFGLWKTSEGTATVTTRCQCLKPLLHPQQGTETGEEREQNRCGVKLLWLLLGRISAAYSRLAASSRCHCFPAGHEQFPRVTPQESL